jgi:hypothetical protein
MKKTMDISHGGKALTLTVELVTEKEINLDGDICRVKCAEIVYSGSFDGMWNNGRVELLSKPVVVSGFTLVAFVETHVVNNVHHKFGLTAEDLAAYRAMEAEVEAAPEYAAKLVAAAKRDADEKTYYAARPNLCPKCGTYCYGDCESN